MKTINHRQSLLSGIPYLTYSGSGLPALGLYGVEPVKAVDRHVALNLEVLPVPITAIVRDFSACKMKSTRGCHENGGQRLCLRCPPFLSLRPLLCPALHTWAGRPHNHAGLNGRWQLVSDEVFPHSEHRRGSRIVPRAAVTFTDRHNKRLTAVTSAIVSETWLSFFLAWAKRTQASNSSRLVTGGPLGPLRVMDGTPVPPRFSFSLKVSRAPH